MNDYRAILRTYLTEKQPDYGSADIHSLIEMLCQQYILNNPIDSREIRCRFAEMDSILDALSLKDNNRVFEIVCDLCLKHEQLAFMEGFRVGARLIEEIKDCVL